MLLMSRQEGAADPLKTRTNEFRGYARPINDTCPSVPLITETIEKCSFLFKFKEGDNFNQMNTLSILRIKI
jgi:hypothetical protein